MFWVLLQHRAVQEFFTRPTPTSPTKKEKIPKKNLR